MASVYCRSRDPFFHLACVAVDLRRCTRVPMTTRRPNGCEVLIVETLNRELTDGLAGLASGPALGAAPLPAPVASEVRAVAKMQVDPRVRYSVVSFRRIRTQ